MPIFEKRQSFSKPSPIQRPSPISRPSPIQKPIIKKPSPPKTLFEEKKDWARTDFLRKTSKAPLKTYSSYERKKMIEKEFPVSRFGTYISKDEANRRLKEMGTGAKGKERVRLDALKKYLKKEAGLK